MRSILPADVRRRRVVGGLALVAVGTAVLTSCGSSEDGRSSAATSAASPRAAESGVLRPDRPLPKPRLVLTDENGDRFDLVERTKGRPTLLYFGYTHCPDVCPTTMADVANAVRTLPAAERTKFSVVFVTTDPARDKPKRLKDWLAAFDARFVGLTGDFASVRRAARTVGVSIEPPVKSADGGYTVSHGAEVLAFFPTDDKAHLIFTAGVPARQYAAALPEILKGGTA
ncbi:SCO family protein [Actinomadura rayongensis]|uniref:SCO family protein n=1 Tax=Actinomadura rayongensis TaxID=1429076 RepID=A0A6I4W7V1_9ACTN|nr:SCO family protein [Actinomadura rayongensis]MXQ64276.1 SCO family protein [Actinomadura rayongensis]